MEVLIDGVRYVPEDQTSDFPEGYASPHFREDEFACNHCGALPGGVDAELLEVLEKLRSDLGDNPVTVTSGYRCKTHNDNVGSSDASQHRHAPCHASDIQVKNVSPNSVHAYLVGTYPDQYGIGRYDSFTHVDMRDMKARW